jgi:hypothetical protein
MENMQERKIKGRKGNKGRNKYKGRGRVKGQQRKGKVNK